MTPALWFFVATIAFILTVDYLFMVGKLPGGTITSGVRRSARRWPLAWHAVYFVLAVFGYWHFFVGR